MICSNIHAHGLAARRLTLGRTIAATFLGGALACLFASHPARADIVGEGDVTPVAGAGAGNLPLDGGATTSPVIVGVTDFGILSIDTPAFTLPLTSPSGQIGLGPLAIGQATVSGFFSEWIVEEFMSVGVSGQGYLNITSGGRVTLGPDPADDENAFVGQLDGSQGFVTINGIGSQWRHDFIRIGDRGHGSIVVTAGGRLETADEAILGYDREITGTDNAIGTGYVEVSGTGSRWNVGDGATDGNLTIGREGRGDVYVRAGGMVRVVEDAIIGERATAVGTVTVSDINSTFWAQESIFIANLFPGARGELHIDSGGEARADIDVVVGPNGLIELYTGLPNTPTSVLRTPLVTNAGLIRGAGRIEAATVNNTGDIRNATYTDGYRERLVFTGIVNNSENIESIGGEMEFEGPVNNSGANADIFGVDSILRFNGGLTNTGRIHLDNTVVESATAVVSAAEFVVAASESDLIGSLTFTGANTMFVELGDEFSKLDVTNLATLGGNLSISLGDGYLPRAGDSFEIIEAGSVTGVFQNVLAPALSGINFTVAYFAQSVVVNVNAGFVFDANFNNDAIVDNLDLDILRMNFGMMVAPGTNGDANGDGIVDGEDFLIWQRHLGLPQVVPAVGAVPEPGSLALVLTGLAAAAGCRRRFRASRTTVA